MTSDTLLAAIGTYGSADTEGVYTVKVNAQSGSMELLGAAVAGPDPTFVTSHPSGDYLYAAVRETGEGIIRTFEINRDTGDLNAISSAPSGALSPCHCSVDSTGQFLFVAHYDGGAISMLPINEKGIAESPKTVIEHEGSSVDPARQTAPHPHSITPGPDNQFVYVPDLGTDRIVTYEIEPEEGTLARHAVNDVSPGAGPRHLSFSPDGKAAYVINELDSTVISFSRQSDGTLEKQTQVSTLPAAFDGENKPAEIATHPSGQFVFGSNRGQDAIVTFKVQGKTLIPVNHTPSGGEWPRHFAIDPSGNFLFAENRDSDNITAFHINTETGVLTSVGEQLSIPEPVCMQWISSS